MENVIDLKKLSLEELAGVVNIYPWFALARKELCSRMAGMGTWGESQFAETAMYMGDRKLLSALRGTVGADCSDDNITEVVRKFMADAESVPVRPAAASSGYVEAADAMRPVAATTYPETERPVAIQERRPRFAGADYFSQDEYEKVRRDGDTNLIDYNAPVSAETQKVLSASQAKDLEICTETLAQIYLDQGYLAQARNIYSKLILAYPEKCAYFASLIGKIDELK